jgi:hypothetical protein
VLGINKARISDLQLRKRLHPGGRGALPRVCPIPRSCGSKSEQVRRWIQSLLQSSSFKTLDRDTGNIVDLNSSPCDEWRESFTFILFNHLHHK